MSMALRSWQISAILGRSLGSSLLHATIKSTTSWGASSGTLMSSVQASRVGFLNVQICTSTAQLK